MSERFVLTQEGKQRLYDTLKFIEGISSDETEDHWRQTSWLDVVTPESRLDSIYDECGTYACLAGWLCLREPGWSASGISMRNGAGQTMHVADLAARLLLGEEATPGERQALENSLFGFMPPGHLLQSDRFERLVELVKRVTGLDYRAMQKEGG